MLAVVVVQVGQVQLELLPMAGERALGLAMQQPMAQQIQEAVVVVQLKMELRVTAAQAWSSFGT
jgi:hypothetical protein